MEEHKILYQAFKTSLKDELNTLVEMGAIATNLDLDFEAAAWIALMDGIGVNMLAAPNPIQMNNSKQ